MNRKFLTQLAILALVCPLLVVKAQEPTGILHGIVVRDDTSEPIRDAVILLGRNTATTDRDGRFTIAGLTPGRYRVTAQREGYFAPDAGDPGTVLAQTTATITAQQTTEVKLTLVPGGTISGRVVGRTAGHSRTPRSKSSGSSTRARGARFKPSVINQLTIAASSVSSIFRRTTTSSPPRRVPQPVQSESRMEHQTAKSWFGRFSRMSLNPRTPL